MLTRHRLVLCLSIVVALKDVAKVRIVDSKLSAAEISNVALKKHKTIDGTLLYRIDIRVLNNSRTPLSSIPIEYEIWSAEGKALGGGIIEIQNGLESLEEGDFEVNAALGGIVIGPQDQVVFRPSALTATQSSLKTEIDPCQAFCDRCAEIAGSLCTHGTQNFSCTCQETSKNCSFSCHPAT